MNVLQEADILINGDRLDAYEGTDDTIVALWSGYLGLSLTVLDYANLMILMKVARTKGKYHRDSYVDIAGYAGVGTRLWEEKKGDTAIPQGPRVWQSIIDIPVGVEFTDRDGDRWFSEQWRIDVYRSGEEDSLEHHSPFTEVLS